MKFPLIFKKNKKIMKPEIVVHSDEPIVHPYISPIPSVELDANLSVEFMEWILKEKNPCNRPVLKSRVQQYTASILNGAWDKDTGNSIRFDSNGNLMDGQHRLAAHITALTPMKTIVIYGIPPKSMKHIDENAPRNLAVRSLISDGVVPTRDAVKLLSNKLAVSRLWILSENNFKNSTNGGVKLLLTPQNLEDLISKKNSFIESAIIARGENSNVRRVGYRTAVAQYFEKDSAKAEEFHNGVSGDGANLSSDSPILWLRNYLNKMKGGGGTILKQDYRATLSAIHKFHNGKPAPKLLRVKDFQETWEF